MTRETAIKILDRRTTIPGDGYSFKDINLAIDMAMAALRPITREQVEKMRGMWIGNDGTEVDMVNEYTQRSATCSECKSYLVGSREYYCKGNFCPACGAPMTDKAVDILWKRLEAMRDEN